jgi:hypothetical protein
METLDGFKDELKELKKDIYKKGEDVDVKDVASWVDRLVISLEKITDTLDALEENIEVLSDADECCQKKASKTKKPGKKGKKKR